MVPDSSRYEELAHQVLAADNLGDDEFIFFISNTFKIHCAKFNSSNKLHHVKMALRDRMRVKIVVPSLTATPQGHLCFACKKGYTGRKQSVVIACCSKNFHRNCLHYLSVCPFCHEAWEGLLFIKCKRPAISKYDKEKLLAYKRLLQRRMICCGVDIHPPVQSRITRICLGCGEDHKE